MFSYVDLVRVEIALEAGEHFGVTVPDEETDGWRTRGDVARSVGGRVSGPTEPQVFDWLRTLVADGYGVTAVLTADEPVFDDYDRMTSWFAVGRLADRRFAGRPLDESAAESEAP